jgi:hypothetical protein
VPTAPLSAFALSVTRQEAGSALRLIAVISAAIALAWRRVALLIIVLGRGLAFSRRVKRLSRRRAWLSRRLIVIY